ncbi:phosphoribosyltransferase domain-containing protein [Salipiger marinus]|uniref:TRSP domain C terminus to PRTase_2 n=1 Tax=Salipiger marinus TaxID=555512 RepID=A0A1G8UJC9_9RHOB|nr:phosphoribosyltransferase domain-containing protein [Salipiger marinus]SDJ53888.1 TRSP domain C terminus to PRTase_2 [Salipiger marinus]
MTQITTGSGWTAHKLSAGTLHLQQSHDQPKGLFRIAERINPKRAFLFVSTVLGRHIPVSPAAHRAALRTLAEKVSPHLLSGPVFVMGYAETAVGLGAGVFQELCRLHPERALGYLATTRFEPSADDVWFRIEEPHSHASDHSVLKPAPGVLHDGANATLVLVDDETTTGTTFRNLAEGLFAHGARFGRIVLVTLTDWSEGAAPSGVSGAVSGADVRAVSLFQGAWRWRQEEGVAATRPPEALPAACPIWTPSCAAAFEVARRGLSALEARNLFEAEIPRIAREADLENLPSDSRILVLGAGEHVWTPFLFAEACAERFVNTRFVATTRSPVMQGETIAHKIVFPDHYGLGLPMYLHNVLPGDWDAIVLFNETGTAGLPRALLDALGRVAAVDAEGRVDMLVRRSRGAAA